MNDYLTDPRDRAVLGACPTLMQPIYGDLEPCPAGSYRFVIANDGVYLQGSSPVIQACVRVSHSKLNLPYGHLEPFLKLADGRLPSDMYLDILKYARAAAPKEWACMVLYDPNIGYYLHRPEIVESSNGHIVYRTDGYDPDELVLDLHTHGCGPAYFSSVDDQDDRVSGLYLSMVIGKLDTPFPESVFRLVCHGHLISLDVDPWEQH